MWFVLPRNACRRSGSAFAHLQVDVAHVDGAPDIVFQAPLRPALVRLLLLLLLCRLVPTSLLLRLRLRHDHPLLLRQRLVHHHLGWLRPHKCLQKTGTST